MEEKTRQNVLAMHLRAHPVTYLVGLPLQGSPLLVLQPKSFNYQPTSSSEGGATVCSMGEQWSMVACVWLSVNSSSDLISDGDIESQNTQYFDLPHLICHTKKLKKIDVTPVNPCHGCGFFWGPKTPTRARARTNPWHQPVWVCKPVTFPTDIV
jgi:hypothetical protein